MRNDKASGQKLDYLFIYFQLQQSRAERSERCTDRVTKLQLKLQLLQRRESILVSLCREMSEKKSYRADQNRTQTRVRLINQPADSSGRFSVVWYDRPWPMSALAWLIHQKIGLISANVLWVGGIPVWASSLVSRCATTWIPYRPNTYMVFFLILAPTWNHNTMN